MAAQSEVSAAVELVATLRWRGLWIERNGSDAFTVGPPDLLDDDTAEALRRLKPAVLEVLATRKWLCVRCGKHWFPAPTICRWCREKEGGLHA